ncbi:transmembrane protein 134 isoform X3 [Balaenoptera musculus]|uniref:Transmembrane protein 134 isoform X3 n=1 Tax=Balaenoptera musculus TaxID=9771 RepID=A0A8B8Y4C8_BALMU|nr:transmembrane protein 134 isoform X3 [Balaenoptera musculus]
MTLSSCPWRTRALGPSTAGSPASGRCTSSAGPGSRWPTRTSSPGCATSHYWRAQSPDLAARPSPPAGDPNLESPLILEGREEGPEPSHPSEACVLEQNLENDEDGAQASPEPEGGASTRDSGRTSIRSSQWSFSNISTSTQRSYNACCSWTQHPLIQKNHRVVLASFLLLLLGLGLSHAGGCGRRSPPCHQLLPLLLPSPSWLHLCAVLILTGVGLEVAPSPGVSSAIFFVPGFLLLVPGVYHVIFIYCAVKGHRGFQFFYLPYFEK